MSLRDSQLDYYQTTLGKTGVLENLEREYFINAIGDNNQNRSWADAALAYYAAWNGSNPAGSLYDEAFKYYSGLSGLTPAQQYTLTDHIEAVFVDNGGPNLTPPVTDQLEAFYSAELPDGYQIDGRTSKNLLTFNQATVAIDTTGLSSGSAGQTITRDGSDGFSSAGSIQSVRTSTTGDIAIATGSPYASIVGGRTYTAVCRAKAVVTNDNARLYINWFDSSQVFISSSAVTAVAATTGSWTQLVRTAVAPSNAAYASINLQGPGSTVVAGSGFKFDDIGLWEGSSTDWVHPGKIHPVNLLPYNAATAENPNITGLTNVDAFTAGAPNSVVISAADKDEGNYSWLLSRSSAGQSVMTAVGMQGADSQNRISASAGEYFVIGGSVKQNAGAGAYAGAFKLTVYDAAGAYITDRAVGFTTSGSWQRLAGAVLMPANTAYVKFEPYFIGTAGGDSVYFDRMFCYRGGAPLAYRPPYRGKSAVNDGEKLRVWTDLSGKGRHLYQDTVANQPEFRKPNLAGTVSKNLLTYNTATAEIDATGFGVGNGVLARTTAQALTGEASMQVTADGVGAASIYAGPTGTGAIPVIPGQQYTGYGAGRSAAVSRTMSIAIDWYTAAGVFISATNIVLGSSSTTAWIEGAITGTAPSNAAFASVRLTISGPAAAEVHYGDKFGFWAGTSRGWIAPSYPVENLLSYNQATVETDLTGISTSGLSGSPPGNCTPTRITTDKRSGLASVQLSSVAAGDMQLQWGISGTIRAPVVAGRQYSAVAHFKSAAVARTAIVSILWFSSLTGGFLSTSAGTGVTTSTSAWKRAHCTATAPPGATHATVTVTIQATAAASELHMVDDVGIWRGEVLIWEPPTTTPNNKALIQFDGVDDGLSFIGNIPDYPLTIYTVEYSEDAPASTQYNSVATSQGADNGVRIRAGAGGADDATTYSGVFGFTYGVGATKAWKVDATKIPAGSGLPDLYVNGTLQVRDAAGAATPLASGGAIHVGHSPIHGTNPLRGNLAAVLIYSGYHDDTNRQRITRWLGSLYGVTVA